MIRQQLKLISKSLLILSCIVIMSSCGSRKDIIYFQDEPITDQSLSELDNNYEIRYKPNDILTIDVSSQNTESVLPFNLPAVAYNNTNAGATEQTTVLRQTYLLDPQGNIEFPTLGTIKLGGLTRTEATEMFKEKIGEYVNEFIVNIRLINFTITVSGEVKNPGNFTVQGERISLIQALGLAGDLTIYGKRDNIFLIREIDGKKKYAKYDLTSINVVNSPVYYLSQNDIIYVEPNNSKVRTSTYNPNTGVLISAVSLLATIAAIFITRN
ncbi:polysaccharide biosynthesis/export family protein [Psychroserpens damuponensis]|uniref:polysaccharide biosynthesis/export family protein n=1 Tax=Psychroserpens damuponensis TaxID=943936 RepID=UPI0005916EEB|nr:polysaccharide biosynthesis/export family protein [Psychroserpens damuponensis]